MNLTMPIVIGATLGLGIFALVRALMPTKRSAVATVARIDAMRARGAAYESSHRAADAEETGRRSDWSGRASSLPVPQPARTADERAIFETLYVQRLAF